MNVVKKLSSLLFELVQSFVIAGAIFVIIYFFLFRPFQVNGQSMYPTYDHGELIITNLITLRFNHIKRGDVIVFKAPPNQEKDYIKRVIGVPGDKIALKNGRIYVNGKELDEHTYIPDIVTTYGGNFLKEDQEITVPENNYFVMGDNRGFSSDSREWGFVSADKIIGKSAVVIWPPQKFEVIQGVQYN